MDKGERGDFQLGCEGYVLVWIKDMGVVIKDPGEDRFDV